MKISSLDFSSVYDRLNFKLKFKPGVNFLWGINGSGKTTVLNLISWLLTPCLDELTRVPFEQLQIFCRQNGRQVRVWAKRQGDGIVIGTSDTDEVLNVPDLGLEADLPEATWRHGPVPERTEFYERFLLQSSDNEAVRRLRELATPLYLPLDRRWAEERARGPRRRGRSWPLRGPLRESLEQIVDLAQQAYSSAQTELAAENEALKTQMLLCSFTAATTLPRWFKAGRPEDIGQRRTVLWDTLQRLDMKLTQTDQRRFNSFFERLERLAAVAKAWSPGETKEIPEEVVEWLANSPKIETIDALIKLIEAYKENARRVFAGIELFKSTVNEFFHDTQKSVDFSRTAELVIRSGDIVRGPDSLSSGEQQVLILIAHLCFQKPIEAGRVFLVDEPELSLHLKWQRQLVGAITGVDSKAQFILATHSPEIIGGREEGCIEVNPWR